jgi:hypothetical protein
MAVTFSTTAVADSGMPRRGAMRRSIVNAAGVDAAVGGSSMAGGGA